MLLGSANIVLRNALTTALLIRSISHVCLLYLGPFQSRSCKRPDSVMNGGWLNLLFSTFPPDVKEVIQGSHKLEVKDPNNPKHLMREMVASVLG